MTPANDRSDPSPAARAQAAVWVARLHGPDRSDEVERGLRRWLADDPDHAAAFELLTDTWEKSAQLRRRPMERVTSWDRIGFRMSFSRAMLSAAVTFAFAVVATLFYMHHDGIVTGVGELRTVTLEDGTRVQLNTDTRIVVRYDKAARRVRLDRGEALFEVASHRGWPFVVAADGREITALGTQFVVRRNERDLAVILVDGKVAVDREGSLPESRQHPAHALSSRALTLSPGERVTFTHAAPPKIDRPTLARVTAWQRGQVAFDNTSLADAAAEMNRYSPQRIVIEDQSVAAIRISGIFQAGNLSNFSQALAAAYHVRARTEGSVITLSAPAGGLGSTK
jgi:transmembrane sensor